LARQLNTPASVLVTVCRAFGDDTWNKDREVSPDQQAMLRYLVEFFVPPLRDVEEDKRFCHLAPLVVEFNGVTQHLQRWDVVRVKVEPGHFPTFRDFLAYSVTNPPPPDFWCDVWFGRDLAALRHGTDGWEFVTVPDQPQYYYQPDPALNSLLKLTCCELLLHDLFSR
jgi:hypothetical protein